MAPSTCALVSFLLCVAFAWVSLVEALELRMYRRHWPHSVHCEVTFDSNPQTLPVRTPHSSHGERNTGRAVEHEKTKNSMGENPSWRNHRVQNASWENRRRQNPNYGSRAGESQNYGNAIYGYDGEVAEMEDEGEVRGEASDKGDEEDIAPVELIEAVNVSLYQWGVAAPFMMFSASNTPYTHVASTQPSESKEASNPPDQRHSAPTQQPQSDHRTATTIRPSCLEDYPKYIYQCHH